ncbi:hypothetical protein [Leptolyngbya sp. GGD]|uniref:hypothetical protein n=1 Tax=Leptolyngbya sp. GGD TaxID=2997907 RepID=UPI00227D5C07|nr:hypothetical protein [Leptolyngbya sp. GGD]MCY6494330.1 hypothetical protein [Leptolyngbya sp. GGD]
MLEIYQKLESFRTRIVEIQQQSEHSTQAAQWLCKYRNLLIVHASEAVFDISQGDGNIRIRGEHLQISRDGYRLFRRDIYVYLKWIGHYMGMGGMTPKILSKELLALPIDYRFYIKAFTAIRNNKVAQADRSEVSRDALQMLVRYFNRFLISRENQEL